MCANSAQGRSIHRMRKIRYIVKTVTYTVLIKTASTITTMFTRKFYKCKDCYKIKKNTCSYTLCRNCDDYVKEDNHECYIQPKVTKSCPEKTIHFFIMKQNKIPGFTTQTYLMVQNFYFRTNDEFLQMANIKSTIKGIQPLRIMPKCTTHSHPEILCG